MMDENTFMEYCKTAVEIDIAERFEDEMKNINAELPIISPIERMMYMALWATSRMYGIPDSDPINFGKEAIVLYGISIKPQYRIGRYRVDFLVTLEKRIHNNRLARTILDKPMDVIVECDSQEWHERSERERRKEKQRDRYLISKGYRVFHYTGKEITDDALKPADEVIRFILRDIG